MVPRDNSQVFKEKLISLSNSFASTASSGSKLLFTMAASMIIIPLVMDSMRWAEDKLNLFKEKRVIEAIIAALQKKQKKARGDSFLRAVDVLCCYDIIFLNGNI